MARRDGSNGIHSYVVFYGWQRCFCRTMGGVRMRHSKDANSHLVSRKNPGGMMNGTFPADLRYGKLEMSQTLYGDIVHSKNEDAIYFVGGKYKRVKP